MSEDLERQVERGSLFTHTALSANAERLTEVETVLYGLLDVLVADGTVDEHAVIDAAAAVRAQLQERGETVAPGVALRVEADAAGTSITPVDCAERMHVCHAVCCRLWFALTAEEVEGGVVKWDLGQPYHIRQNASGACVHNEATGSCGVYADRPGVCKGYSCADDDRIWQDFERMELNHEWIAAHLTGSKPRLASAIMIRLDPPAPRRGAAPPDAPEQ
jgi:hypothetical protein